MTGPAGLTSAEPGERAGSGPVTELAGLTSAEAGERAAGGAFLVVPVASTEQHGPHLPLSTDTDLAVALCGGLSRAWPGAVIAPPLAYGSSGEHQDFPGTLSIGQDLGLTLDFETWNVRASALGIRQQTDLVVLDARDEAAGPADGAAGGARRLVLELLHHPTGTARQLACDWVACAVPPRPADELWHALDGAPFERHRVGDCRAPRRAHAAIIEGDRAGAAL